MSNEFLFNPARIITLIQGEMNNLSSFAANAFPSVANNIPEIINNVMALPISDEVYLCSIRGRNGFGGILLNSGWTIEQASEHLNQQCLALAYAGLFGALASDALELTANDSN